MNKAASKKISYLYFIFTFFIIGLHSVSLKELGLSGGEQYVRILYNAATGGFMFFSAFLLYRKEHNYFQLIKKKMFSLLLPFLLYNVIAVFYKQLFLVVIKTRTLPQGNLAGLMSMIWSAEENPPLWFMKTLMVYIVLYPLIQLLLKQKAVAIAAIVISGVVQIIRGADVGYSTIFYWMPIYLMGAVVAQYDIELFCDETKSTMWRQLIAAGSLLILILLAKENDEVMYLYRVLSPVLIWECSTILTELPKPKWWINCTVFYYGMHILVTRIAQKIYMPVGRLGSIFPLLGTFVIPLIC